MFGKGIYFADCVSKSAQYCHASGEHNDGFLLLSEVAIGKMEELMGAKDITKPKKGCHSVKGLGATVPDPKGFIEFDGMTVPCGKAKAAGQDRVFSLLYNEYIVYNEAQVRLRYLLHTTIDYS
jgi:poly [ADP-ribose] polymerase